MTLYRRLLRALRERYPVDCRVRRVKRSVIDGNHGLCWPREDGGFEIRIASDLGEEEACHTLIHEWAHAIGWMERVPHGKRWGAAHAKCYRVWEEL